MTLMLPGGINLNPGSVTIYQIKDHKFDVFNCKELHFIHLTIDSLLHKIDELHYAAKSSNAAVIGVSETQLDNIIYDSEVAIDGYNLSQVKEIEKVVALLVMTETCFFQY